MIGQVKCIHLWGYEFSDGGVAMSTLKVAQSDCIAEAELISCKPASQWAKEGWVLREYVLISKDALSQLGINLIPSKQEEISE